MTQSTRAFDPHGRARSPFVAAAMPEHPPAAEPVSRRPSDVRPGDLAAAAPGLYDGGRRVADERLVTLLDPHSYGAQQYRALRLLVEHAHRSSGLSLLAVSSPDVGEGKTTTAINLAGALAQAFEGRVLLVDADLHRPAVALRLGLDPDHEGLVDVILDDRLSLAAVAQPYSPANLSIVSAGRLAGVTYEVLHSPRLGSLLDDVRRDYDYVVVDTPPLLPIPDARVIAKWVDSFLLVVRANKTPRKLVGDALSLVGPDKVLGFVYNDDVRPSHRHRDYYYASSSRSAGQAPGRWGRMLRTLRGVVMGGR